MENLKKFIFGIKEGQKLFGETIAIVINSLLLTIAYFIGVGITFIMLKISKIKLMDLTFDKESKTYWSDLNLSKKPIGEYYRQF